MVFGADVVLAEPDGVEALRILALMKRLAPALEVAICGDGVEVVEYVFRVGRHWVQPEGRLRLVLVDESIPALSWREVLRRIRSSAANDDVQVILLADGRLEAAAEDRVPLGVTARLIKPVTADALARGLFTAELAMLDEGLESG